MAAPALTPRGVPNGIPLTNGHKTLITFGSVPRIALWEKPTKPPGVNGGDAIDITTMHNNLWNQMAPRALQTLTEVTSTVAYDPAVYEDIVAIVNVVDEITITHSNGDQLGFWGFLRIAEATENAVDGQQPEMQITITPAMYDPTDAGILVGGFDEVGPVISSTPGTGNS